MMRRPPRSTRRGSSAASDLYKRQADDASKFSDALAANVPAGTEVAASYGAVAGRNVTLLADLLATPVASGLDAVHDAIGPDTIAKFLLTSGSTGNPKAVINTQRMICACLLYTSDAADDLLCVDLGGRRIIKKKNNHVGKQQW